MLLCFYSAHEKPNLQYTPHFNKAENSHKDEQEINKYAGKPKLPAEKAVRR